MSAAGGAKRVGTDLASTQQYLTPASSARTGRCERMSIGVMLEASSRRPFSPLRSDLTTSLTPRLSCRAFDAVRKQDHQRL